MLFVLFLVLVLVFHLMSDQLTLIVSYLKMFLVVQMWLKMIFVVWFFEREVSVSVMLDEMHCLRLWLMVFELLLFVWLK